MSRQDCMKTNFSNYLLQKGYAPSSVSRHLYNTEKLLVFLNREKIDPEHARQADILAFIKQQKSTSPETKSHCLLSIKHFFGYLKAARLIARSPAENLRIRGLKRNTLYTLLEPHELHELYAAFPKDPRKKALLGFLIYQGLQALELPKLETPHLDLREGTIFIPEGRRSEARTLPLHTAQILDLHEYVTYTRPELLKKMNITTDQLLLGSEQLRLVNSIALIMSALRKQHAHIKPLNTKQIRTSVIVNWLKNHHLRQTQYFAGHRYIGSTEKYLQNDTESLSREVETFHPLDRI